MRHLRRTVVGLLICTCWLLTNQPRLAQGQGTLASVAGSMPPGTWAAVPQSNMDGVLEQGNHSGNKLSYTNAMAYNPISQKLHFVGEDHNWPSTPASLYDLATNSWTDEGPIGPGLGHGYDHNVVNPLTGEAFFRAYNSQSIYSRSQGGSWGVRTAMPVSGWPNNAGGLAWWSGSLASGGSGGNLVFYNCGAPGGEIQIWDATSDSWTLPITGFGGESTYHCIAEYSPIHNMAIVGGGNANAQKIWRISADRTVTALPDAPVGLGINQSNVTVDPVSGDFLIMGYGQLWVLDPTGPGSWTQQAAPPLEVGNPGSPDLNSIMSAPITDYGVVAYVSYRSGIGGMYLYKHAPEGGTPPPPDSSAPSIPTNLSATPQSSTQISLSWTASTDNVGVTGYQVERCEGASCGAFSQVTFVTGQVSYIDTGLSPDTVYRFRIRAVDAASNLSAYSSIVDGTTPSASLPSGIVGGYPMPSLQDEIDTYASWGWTWSGSQESTAVTEPISNYTVTDPDIHYDTEGDDLWTYLMMYRRTGNPVYSGRADAWARFFKDDYLDCIGSSGASFCYDRNAFGADHIYGWGLLALYEQDGDVNALAEAERLGAVVEELWATSQVDFGCYPAGGCIWYGVRAAGRQLLLITRLAEVTQDNRWIALRDELIEIILSSAYWDSQQGMYFLGSFSTDSAAGSGAYASGLRIASAFQIGVFTEALFHAYRTTGNTAIRDRIVAMANFVQQHGLDPVYQYTSSYFGVDGNGQTYHGYAQVDPVTFWDPVYTTSLVNTLVLGYKYTGNSSFLDRAKVHLNRGTKGIYGSPTARAAADDAVHHFIDTQFDASGGSYSLAYNKGELPYTYLIFENGGSPTVESGTPVVDTSPPVVSVQVGQ